MGLVSPARASVFADLRFGFTDFADGALTKSEVFDIVSAADPIRSPGGSRISIRRFTSANRKQSDMDSGQLQMHRYLASKGWLPEALFSRSPNSQNEVSHIISKLIEILPKSSCVVMGKIQISLRCSLLSHNLR
ncbi:hypothetical protein D8674_013914 [Pyrus ussuriensis x Pyrus communis]|uniref:Uncharacterized protein n=1 Tax=Pyrus ussuriensis x Pyrus communis TaxID=2448454 RepID=A0A5N5GR19_9ROSA|nr:hypothetical protein D8674_013914 [Pyrus ussuriensis x Pyrus communis]